MSRRLSTFGTFGVLAVLAVSVLTADAGAQTHQRQQRLAADPEPATGPLIAPPAACPGSNRLDIPRAAAEQAMLCLTDYARREVGLASLVVDEALTESAWLKTRDLLRCGEFSHEACGRDFTYWFEQTGYLARNCWRVGEVLAYGRGPWGTARSIFIAWMRSPSHREIILGDYVEIGVDLQAGFFAGGPGTRVWTQHLGAAGCPAPPPS
jgi:uncharacterized protein YkwD